MGQPTGRYPGPNGQTRSSSPPAPTAAPPGWWTSMPAGKVLAWAQVLNETAFSYVQHELRGPGQGLAALHAGPARRGARRRLAGRPGLVVALPDQRMFLVPGVDPGQRQAARRRRLSASTRAATRAASAARAGALMAALTLYGIANCDTVKRARAWLGGSGRGLRLPRLQEGRRAAARPGPLARRRRLGAAAQPPGHAPGAGSTRRSAHAVHDAASARALMLAQPSVIKRPGGAVARRRASRVGFDAADWASAPQTLSSKKARASTWPLMRRSTSCRPGW